VPPGAWRHGQNSIVVRVTDTGGGGGIDGQAEVMRLEQPQRSGGEAILLAGDWPYRVGMDAGEHPDVRRAVRVTDTPSALYNAMIAPLVPYGLRGFIWYQGESNADRAEEYRTLFPAMIQDWRASWRAGGSDAPKPFYFVQLAAWYPEQTEPVEDTSWPLLREAQAEALALDETGMVVTLDVGDAGDIHPRDKHSVGRRLARHALAGTYGRDGIATSGPVYAGHEVEGRALRVRFDHAERGLRARGGDSGSDLRGFALAGSDGVWHWAEAEIDGGDVVLTSEAVELPVAARYAWAMNPVGNLVGTDDLPAAPFRTDR
jgi:sialate O-acetylesterase